MALEIYNAGSVFLLYALLHFVTLYQNRILLDSVILRLGVFGNDGLLGKADLPSADLPGHFLIPII